LTIDFGIDHSNFSKHVFSAGYARQPVEKKLLEIKTEENKKIINKKVNCLKK
tara:strand:+ start:390 stop:545 length:156 start_codon:yes stop_codon:yes gene_type:complete